MPPRLPADLGAVAHLRDKSPDCSVMAVFELAKMLRRHAGIKGTCKGGPARLSHERARGKVRDTHRQTDRQTERERERERERGRRERDRKQERERKRQKKKEKENERERKTSHGRSGNKSPSLWFQMNLQALDSLPAFRRDKVSAASHSVCRGDLAAAQPARAWRLPTSLAAVHFCTAQS